MGQFNQINFDYTVLDIALMGRYPFHSLLEQEKSGIMRWLWMHWTR